MLFVNFVSLNEAERALILNFSKKYLLTKNK